MPLSTGMNSTPATLKLSGGATVARSVDASAACSVMSISARKGFHPQTEQ
jgi:hypothetical protein